MAGKEAANKALAQAEVDSPDFVMMFATVGYRQELLLKAVREATGHAPLIGCSGAGAIAQNTADESNFVVSVMAIKSDEMQFARGMATALTSLRGWWANRWVRHFLKPRKSLFLRN